MKKILFLSVFCLITGMTFADDHSSQLKKLLNRKIIFPESLKITEKTTVEIQFEIMNDGCVAITAFEGNPAIVNYISEKISNIKIPYNQLDKKVFVYQFIFEKELYDDSSK